jgi:hypothetical protein
MGARGIRLIYGGGGIGLMGATARAALAAGGEVLGIIPQFLTKREVALDTAPVEVVDDLHQRKARMAELADGFIVLPGGIGTLEEAVEVLSWARLSLHAKPVVFLDNNDFYNELFAFFTTAAKSGFIPGWAVGQAQHSHDIEDAINRALQPCPSADPSRTS